MKPQNKAKEIDFFNKFIDNEEEDYDVFQESGWNKILKQFEHYIQKNFPNQQKIKVIDFGCGTGKFTSKLLNKNFKLYGVDISDKCIETAKKKYPEINFFVGDIEHTKFKNEEFDVVILSGVIHHFPDFFPLLKECYRVLKKGGIVLGYDPNKMNPFMFLYRSKESPFYSPVGVTENEGPILKRNVSVNLEKAGFFEKEIYSISGIPYKYVKTKLSIFIPLYNLIDKILELTFLDRMIGSFIITYAKK